MISIFLTIIITLLIHEKSLKQLIIKIKVEIIKSSFNKNIINTSQNFKNDKGN